MGRDRYRRKFVILFLLGQNRVDEFELTCIAVYFWCSALQYIYIIIYKSVCGNFEIWICSCFISKIMLLKGESYLNAWINIKDKNNNLTWGEFPPFRIMSFSLFADDTNIYFESNDLNEDEKKVSCELKELKKWMNINLPSIECCKKKLLLYFDQKICYHVTLIFNRKTFH